MGNKVLCLRYNRGQPCTNMGTRGAFCSKPNDTRKFWHMCAFDAGGKPCGKPHRAAEH